jgi:hypothetical protein
VDIIEKGLGRVEVYAHGVLAWVAQEKKPMQIMSATAHLEMVAAA